MNKDKLKNTINKLFRLSESPNEHEAKRALLKAYELCAKYNIDLTETEVKEQGIVSLKYTPKRGKKVTLDLKMALCCAEFFGCQSHICKYASGYKELYVVGSQANVETVFDVLDFTLDVFNKLFKEFWAVHKKTTKLTRYRCHSDYRLGFFSGVYRALSTHQEENALIVIKPKEIEEFNKEHKLRASRKMALNYYGDVTASEAGYVDGKASYSRNQIGDNK